MRTAWDLARWLPTVEAVVAMDALARVGRFAPTEVLRIQDRYRRARGRRRVPGVIDLADPRAESPMETRSRLVLVLRGLPRPELQYEVYDELGEFIARLDMAYPLLKLAMEYDGSGHLSTWQQQSDARRLNRPKTSLVSSSRNGTVGAVDSRGMRQLLPVAADAVDLEGVYGDLPVAHGRPAVRLNMIASLDGAATVDGLSGGLGGPADHRVFQVLRGLADVVLVAAGTVRAEGYGPSKVPLAIVTRSCALDLGSPLFTAGARPMVLTVATAPPERLAAAGEVADVLIAGERSVDPRAALRLLGEAGYRRVLAEGGPSLNAQLAAADLVDELCLTVAPCLVGGDSRRILAGPPAGMTGFALHTLCEEGGYLFLRLRRAGLPSRA